MNLLVADATAMRELLRRGLLPRVAAMHRVCVWDFVAWTRSPGPGEAKVLPARLPGRVVIIETEAAVDGTDHMRPGFLAADAFPRVSGNDVGLLAAWAAAALAEVIRTGGLEPGEFIALAEEALVVQALRHAGMAVHEAAWLDPEGGGEHVMRPRRIAGR